MGFFEDLGKKVNETTASFQETTNRIEKENKYKKTISQNNKKIDAIYIEIGKKVYESDKNDKSAISFIDARKKEISEILTENDKLQTEILDLNNKKRCSNCGKEIEKNAPFCTYCGEKQEVPKENIPDGKKKCSKCGEIIDDTNVFCPNCGTKCTNIGDEEVAKVVEVDEMAEADEQKKVDK